MEVECRKSKETSFRWSLEGWRRAEVWTVIAKLPSSSPPPGDPFLSASEVATFTQSSHTHFYSLFFFLFFCLAQGERMMPLASLSSCCIFLYQVINSKWVQPHEYIPCINLASSPYLRRVPPLFLSSVHPLFLRGLSHPLLARPMSIRVSSCPLVFHYSRLFSLYFLDTSLILHTPVNTPIHFYSKLQPLWFLLINLRHAYLVLN